ncbi:hypothetical protein [Qipengyuania sp. 902]|uniref:hypothetical protein n=1 Tax=Qipengyuania sp. 902 TaxID=3417565 RepID=UPI003EBA3C58
MIASIFFTLAESRLPNELRLGKPNARLRAAFQESCQAGDRLAGIESASGGTDLRHFREWFGGCGAIASTAVLTDA